MDENNYDFNNSMDEEEKIKAIEEANNTMISEIKGLYVPCYLYELKCNVKASGRTHYYEHTSRLDIKSYFKTDYSFHYSFFQDASVKLNDYIMTSIEPYHFEDAQKFHPVYLNGFSSENGDKNLEEIEKMAKIFSGHEANRVLYRRLEKHNKDIHLDSNTI